MTADLTEAVQRCETCQQKKPALSKEPMMTYPVPTLPWQIVASDCFECDNQHYPVVVDLYSDFIEIRKLDTWATLILVEKLKQVFAIHGVPVNLISDNSPYYASAEFHKFTQVLLILWHCPKAVLDPVRTCCYTEHSPKIICLIRDSNIRYSCPSFF